MLSLSQDQLLAGSADLCALLGQLSGSEPQPIAISPQCAFRMASHAGDRILKVEQGQVANVVTDELPIGRRIHEPLPNLLCGPGRNEEGSLAQSHYQVGQGFRI